MQLHFTIITGPSCCILNKKIICFCPSVFWDINLQPSTAHNIYFFKHARGHCGSRGALGDEHISGTELERPGQCTGKTACCGAAIIEIFSGRAVLNGKWSGAGAEAVYVHVCLSMYIHVCARVLDKHECYCWWHLNERVNLLLSPPHISATIVLLRSGGLTAATLLSRTRTQTAGTRSSEGAGKRWKWGCASCDGEH